jgi:hypothetical protein
MYPEGSVMGDILVATAAHSEYSMLTNSYGEVKTDPGRRALRAIHRASLIIAFATIRIVGQNVGAAH